jgi:hypothetical protein
MELVERHHLTVHQVLPQLQVPLGQRLDRSEPKVRLEQLGLLVLPVQLVLPGQLGQVQAEPALAEPLALEEPLAQLVELGLGLHCCLS